MVYVLDIDGKPLMPTERHGKVRRLLKERKAKVVKKTPFTIQLLYNSTRYTQPVTLGVDAGSKHIGLSASTETKELLAWDVQCRTDIPELLSTRREARQARRNQKTRYRKNMVYVLDIDGKPLMPTERHGKVRRLLKERKAKVVKKTPFTIQLLYKSTRYTQPFTLGVDAGSKHIGLSASTETKELLAWDVQCRTDIPEMLSTRREARQ